jgi:hypothetical protein
MGTSSTLRDLNPFSIPQEKSNSTFPILLPFLLYNLKPVIKTHTELDIE